MKNVCQTCVFDLEYGLPVAVRDHALQLKVYFQPYFILLELLQDDIPTGDFNKEHFHENLSKEMALQGDDLRGAHSAPNQFLERLSAGRRGPYYKRNLPHICSFWVKVSFQLERNPSKILIRANVAVVKSVRTGTRSRPIPMIHFLSRTLSTVSTVLKIQWPINCSNAPNHFPQSNLQMIKQSPLSG